MRPSALDRLPLRCPACLRTADPQRRDAARLELAQADRETPAGVEHGTLACRTPGCGRRFPILDGVITDSHFHERDRMGRTLAFMARLRQDGIAPSITAVAIDEQTSLFIDRNGRGIVDSNLGGATYVVSERADTVREQVLPGQPLVYRNLQRVRLHAGQWFDFVARTHNGDSTTLSVDGRNAAPFTPADPY